MSENKEYFHAALQDWSTYQKRCDITFVCIDRSNHNNASQIMAHKLILSLASDVFDTMFYGEASQETTETKTNVVKIEDIEFSTFKLFLHFIYCQTVSFETPEAIGEFYYAAHKYNCKDAIDFVSNYMINELTSDNAVTFYDVATIFNNSEVKAVCMKVLLKNTSDVLISHQFLSTTPKTIETIFKANYLDIESETTLIYALERYIKHNEEDDLDVKEKVRPALNHIRFLTLTPKEISRTSLLTADEIKLVIETLTDDELSKMPSYLSVNKMIREKKTFNRSSSFKFAGTPQTPI